jgi:hypothetical protein
MSLDTKPASRSETSTPQPPSDVVVGQYNGMMKGLKQLLMAVPAAENVRAWKDFAPKVAEIELAFVTFQSHYETTACVNLIACNLGWPKGSRYRPQYDKSRAGLETNRGRRLEIEDY